MITAGRARIKGGAPQMPDALPALHLSDAINPSSIIKARLIAILHIFQRMAFCAAMRKLSKASAPKGHTYGHANLENLNKTEKNKLKTRRLNY